VAGCRSGRGSFDAWAETTSSAKENSVGTIAINMFMTLDGVAQAPGAPEEDAAGGFQHGGWQVPHFTARQGEIVDDWHRRAGGLLLGRKTYDIFAAHWPHVPADHEHAEIAKLLNGLPKYVASRSTPTLSWSGSRLLDADVPAAVAALKREDVGELQVIGSLDLAQTLIAHGLVDEFRLMVYPVLLGTGKRLFASGTAPAGLSLVSTETTDAGVTASVYRPVGGVSYGSFGL
jgi:dihydrofolate reductase